MIKYSYKDKELKVPTGIGNNNNEGFEEGFDLGYEEGYEVAYPSGYTNGFSDGHVSGVTEQKAKLVSTAITENGTYSREDGFNEVEVDVQPPLETLSVVQSESAVTYTPDDGYYGIGSISVDASGYGARRWQDGIDWEYNRISQSAITLSFSGNGEWHKDFFSEVFCNEVIVNVPIDDIYESGYTSGVTDGFAIGHASGVTDGFNLGYPSGHTDGYNSGYTIGRQDGISYENSRIHQIAIPLSFSANGEWQQEMFSDVFPNKVSVNVIGKGEDMSKYNIAYCFQVDDPTQKNNFGLFGDGAAEEYLYTYFAEAYCPELGVRQVFDAQHPSMDLSFTTSGNHIVWLSQIRELPSNDEFMLIRTTSPVIQIVTSNQYGLANIFKESDYTQDITAIIDVAQNTPTSVLPMVQGNWYYPSSRATAPSAQGWTAVPVNDDVMNVLKNLYKF